jgi:parallel beta-helix repeat protein
MSGLRIFFVAWLLPSWLLACAAAAEQPPGFVHCRAPAGVRLPPVLDARNFGAIGNGINDDAGAIVAAVASLGDGGGTVLFPPGTYRHSDILVLKSPNVTLAGTGATLLAGNPNRAAIVLEGSNTTILDFTIASEAPGERGDQPEQSGIVMSGNDNAVLGSVVRGFRSAGILVRGARNYVIACNHVRDTKSDGIHSTDGASNGRVAHNSVVNSGDDGIAVVSYHRTQQASAIVIEDNTVENIHWGRGISVIGSTDVVIRGNRITSIAMAAGIIVAREASYNTPGARNVVIESNTIVDIQRTLAPLGGRPRTGHGGIELNSDSDDPALGVSDVTVVGNTISDSGYDGIRLRGNVSRVAILANRLSNIGGRAIAVAKSRRAEVLRCDDNTVKQDVALCK